ncbi:MAG: DUF523 domain-containing protein [Pseudomonadota bacterium]
MKKILISACLTGENVRYDNKPVPMAFDLLEKWNQQGRLIKVCPEVCGGLSVPRPVAQIVDGNGYDVLQGNARVMDRKGNDVTFAFVQGARYALGLAQEYNIQVAVFKEKSPSCGVNQIYDGSFSSILISGSGVTVALLKENGIRVFCENDLNRVESFFDSR